MENLTRAKTPFRFVTQVNLTLITNRRARSLQELLMHLREVPGSVIYHHTHRFLKQHQYLSPEPPNDFAYWVQSMLQDEELGERLAAIDTIRYATLRDLRDKIIQTLEDHMSKNPSARIVAPGQELHLMQTVSFVIPTPHEAWDLAEFGDQLAQVSLSSVYHHVFESRLRLNQASNDFSLWFERELGEQALAWAVARLDPYTQTFDSLRKRILVLIRRRIGEIHAFAR